MISFEEALDCILEEARPLPPETVPLASALGRSLAQDVVAAFDSPRFDNSAVDGFAVLSSDLAGALPVSLPVVHEVFAGDDATGLRIAPGECAKTMTGAQVVGGADAVVMQEDVTCTDGVAVFASPIAEGSSVRRKGEEYRQGDRLVSAGTACSPSVLAVAASQGLDALSVGRWPRVGLVVTGSELVKPGGSLAPGQVFESNSVALSAAVTSLTSQAPCIASVGDDESMTRKAFESMVEQAEVVVFSGGASVGEKDFVRSSLLACGVKERFWRLSMKPGKPVFFGVHPAGALVFALPGNPVSAQVTFELLVVPAILKMAGSASPVMRPEPAVLAGPLKRRPGRKEFVRATTRFEEGKVWAVPLAAQESHMARGLAMADRLIVVEADVEALESGTTVPTVPLRWRMPL